MPVGDGKSDVKTLTYERPQYGSNSSPAQLTRDDEGNYFLYESDLRGVLTLWSTEVDFNGFLKSAESVGLSLGQLASATISQRHDSDLAVVDLSPTEFHEGVRSGKFGNEIENPVEYAVLAWSGLELAWRNRYPRFHDRDTERMEISVYSPNVELELTRRLIDITGNSAFFVGAECVIQVRRKGKTQQYPL